MPQIEQINLGGVRNGFNVGHTVGIQGPNHFGDVLILQAMMMYIHQVYGNQFFGLPETGIEPL